MNETIRPHPGPLPQEREKHSLPSDDSQGRAAARPYQDGAEAGDARQRGPTKLHPELPKVREVLRVTVKEWEDLIGDPVMAAWIIFGYMLDAFQAARLRYYWWARTVIDSSGFSSGKTIIDWIFMNLRCILIPDHMNAVYYPTHSTGKDTFWEYYSQCPGKIYESQMGELNKEGEKKTDKETTESGGTWKANFLNGNVLSLPAPAFNKKSKGASQASKRFNDVLVEEWTHVEAMSDVIDAQLIGRSTRQNWNQHHPIWGNHFLLTAPAATRMHPAYTRHEAHAREVRKGNPKYVNLHYSYKDFSRLKAHTGKSFREEYRQQDVIDQLRKTKERAAFLGEGLGIWGTNGKGWFTEEAILQCIANGKERGVTVGTNRKEVLSFKFQVSSGDDAGGNVRDARQRGPTGEEHAYLFEGVDPAPSEGMRSDDGAMVIGVARPKGVGSLKLEVSSGREKKEPLSQNEADWTFDFVYAKRLTAKEKANSRQYAGILHDHHRRFGLEGIGMDPNGGGVWVKRDLILPDQLINGVVTTRTPIGDMEDGPAKVTHGEFILCMIKRGDPGVEALFPELAGDELLNDAMYCKFKEGLEGGIIGLPPQMKDWVYEHREEWALWSEEKQWAMKGLNALMTQLLGILVATKEDGTYLLTRRGARQFASTMKKDYVSAGMMAYLRFLIWLRMGDFTIKDPKDEAAIISW